MEPTPFDQKPEVMAERLQSLREDVRDLKKARSAADALLIRQGGKIEDLEKAVGTITTGLDRVNTTMTRFALTIAASAVIWGLGVLAATGKI